MITIRNFRLIYPDLMMKFKNLSYLFFLSVVTLLLYSCGAQKPSVIAAEKAFNNEKYYTAADLYKKAIPTVRKKETKLELTFKIGECYRLNNNHKQAATWYDKAIKAGYETPEAYYRLAESYKAMERFPDAIETYQDYLSKHPNDSIATLGINTAKMAQKWKEKPHAFDVFNELSLNTKDMEYAPAYYGKGIIFTSNRGTVKGKNFYERTGKNYENLYAAQQTGKNKWTKAEPLNKDINTPYNEGAASFDAANRILYFTQCNGPKGKDAGCKIYETQNEGNTWSAPKMVEIPNPDSALFAHPSISADGTKLYFTAELKGGFGGKDIWYSEKQGSAWTAPVNAGPKINTPGDEAFPFIHPSGTLYFSSNGHAGIGGYDVFFCDWEEGDWTDATNLKSPVNSTADDFGFILDEEKQTGYMSSNRFGGKGEDDIYSTIAIPLVFNVYGKTINKSTNKALAAVKVTLLGSDGTKQTVTSDATGSYKFALKKDVNYQLNASKYRFFGDVGEASTYSLKESNDFEINFSLNPIPLKEIVIKGILYDLAKADLRPESIVILDSLIKTLNDNPTFVIEIASHTDSRADSIYNYDLSQRRAQSVVDYLVLKGIEKDRLQAKGYGESRLLNECKDGVECTEEQHQMNRRTSFAVVSEDYVPKEAPKIPESGKPKPGVKPGTTAPGTTNPNAPKPATPGTGSSTPAPANTTPATPSTTTPGGTRTVVPATGTPQQGGTRTVVPATGTGTTPAGTTPAGTRTVKPAEKPATTTDKPAQEAPKPKKP